MAAQQDLASHLAEYHQAEQRRDSIANGAFGKPYALCDFGERRDIDGLLTSRQRHVIVIEEARRKAFAAIAPGGASVGGGGVAPADDQERRVVALVNAPEAAGRKLLAQRLAAERAIPLERAATYLAKGPMDPSADEQAKRIAGAHKSAGLDPIDAYLDQVIVAERALAAERIRAIVESPEGLARPTLAHYMAHETALEPSASIAILRKAPIEPSADQVARRIAGAAPDAGTQS